MYEEQGKERKSRFFFNKNDQKQYSSSHSQQKSSE